jgi:nicotinamidase-related amidase
MSAASSTATAGRGVASAQPYRWPYHGALDPSRCALVACLDARWRVPGPASDDGDRTLVRLAGGLREAGVLVVAVTATPLRHPRGEPAADDAPASAPPIEGDLELTAGATSAFHGSPLDDVLRERGCADLVLAGWGLEGPVHSTLRAANDRGYECLLVPDASTTLQSDLAFAACEMVRFSGGIFGAFAEADGVLRAFADHPLPRSLT